MGLLEGVLAQMKIVVFNKINMTSDSQSMNPDEAKNGNNHWILQAIDVWSENRTCQFRPT